MFRTIISPKHVEPFNEKIKTIHKNLCISLVYIQKFVGICHYSLKTLELPLKQSEGSVLSQSLIRPSTSVVDVDHGAPSYTEMKEYVLY